MLTLMSIMIIVAIMTITIIMSIMNKNLFDDVPNGIQYVHIPRMTVQRTQNSQKVGIDRLTPTATRQLHLYLDDCGV